MAYGSPKVVISLWLDIPIPTLPGANWIGKALVEHVTSFQIPWLVGIARNKCPLLCQPPRRNMWRLVIVVLKYFGSSNNYLTSMSSLIIFPSFVITQVLSIKPKIRSCTLALDTLKYAIISLGIMLRRV